MKNILFATFLVFKAKAIRQKEIYESDDNYQPIDSERPLNFYNKIGNKFQYQLPEEDQDKNYYNNNQERQTCTLKANQIQDQDYDQNKSQDDVNQKNFYPQKKSQRRKKQQTDEGQQVMQQKNSFSQRPKFYEQNDNQCQDSCANQQQKFQIPKTKQEQQFNQDGVNQQDNKNLQPKTKKKSARGKINRQNFDNKAIERPKVFVLPDQQVCLSTNPDEKFPKKPEEIQKPCADCLKIYSKFSEKVDELDKIKNQLISAKDSKNDEVILSKIEQINQNQQSLKGMVNLMNEQIQKLKSIEEKQNYIISEHNNLLRQTQQYLIPKPVVDQIKLNNDQVSQELNLINNKVVEDPKVKQINQICTKQKKKVSQEKIDQKKYNPQKFTQSQKDDCQQINESVIQYPQVQKQDQQDYKKPEQIVKQKFDTKNNLLSNIKQAETPQVDDSEQNNEKSETKNDEVPEKKQENQNQNDKLLSVFDRLKKRGSESKTIDLDKFNNLTLNNLKGEPGHRLEKHSKSKEIIEDLNKVLKPQQFKIKFIESDVDFSKEQTVPDGSTVLVNYEGKLLNGQVFDSSYKRNKPFQFTLGQKQVIEGWEYAVMSMKKGQKAVVTIPPELAYGDKGVGDKIPPGAALVFVIEVLDWS